MKYPILCWKDVTILKQLFLFIWQQYRKLNYPLPILPLQIFWLKRTFSKNHLTESLFTPTPKKILARTLLINVNYKILFLYKLVNFFYYRFCFNQLQWRHVLSFSLLFPKEVIFQINRGKKYSGSLYYVTQWNIVNTYL